MIEHFWNPTRQIARRQSRSNRKRGLALEALEERTLLSVLSNSLSPGQNVFQDQSIEGFYDTNQNDIIDGGDVFFGEIRVDNKLAPVSAPMNNQLYVAFSIQLDPAAPPVDTLGAPGNTVDNAQYNLTWRPTPAAHPRSLDSMLAGFGLPAIPAGTIGAVISRPGGFVRDHIIQDPPDIGNGPAGTDITDFIADLASPVENPGRELEFYGGLALPTDFFAGLSATFVPGDLNPYVGGAAAYIAASTPGITVATFAAGMTILLNNQPSVAYNRLVIANNPVTGGASVYDWVLNNGAVSGSDPRSSGFRPDLIDNAQFVVNATLTPTIDIEKTTTGSPNGNATAPDFDNEDSANGVGVPVLTPGTAVTWTYKVTNTGSIAIAQADVTVTDSVPGVTPVRVMPDFVGNNDNLLEPGEMWKYVATGSVLDLGQSPLPAGTTIVQGCGSTNTGGLVRDAYENGGTVTVPGATDSDLSHYCNPKPLIDIEKTTTGSPNGNATPPNFDNEDLFNGPGIPVLTSGTAVTWTYKVTNLGPVTIPLAQVTVTDSVPGVSPVRVTPDFVGNNDNLLEPGEMWKYVATGTVLDLATLPLSGFVVTGCTNVPQGAPPRKTYENSGVVTVPGATDNDLSHYCNPKPSIDIEKTTTGSPNGNSTAADFDNEDGANGTGVPVLTPGTAVSWTYKVTNTGTVTIPLAQVTVTDSVPGVTPVRVTPDFVGNNDNLLEPGEMWKYVATGTVLDLATLPLSGFVVTGCTNVPLGAPPRKTYENSGVVTVPGATDSDFSHYCNPMPAIDIEKTTTGSPNGNATAPDFDNEDSANGAGVPVLTPGSAVTWTYKVTNTGSIAIAQADVSVTDSVPGVTPVRVTPDFVGNNDNLLEPGEMWKYVATGTVLDLATLPLGGFVVTGCTSVPLGAPPRKTYENSGVVTVPGATDSDFSHYCNPAPGIDIEKTTTGSPNGNATAPDFDNEDGANGTGIPVLTPGTTVTWTYKVTNTGTVTIPLTQVTVTDSVPGVTPVRVTPDFVGDNDNLLEPGEMWKYVATGTVLDLGQAPLPAGTTIVQGCGSVSTGGLVRNTYENSGVVTVPGSTDSDLSHYCNPKPCVDIQKKTTGSPNGNATAVDFDNEDSANGTGVPVLTPGTTVTWTYKVTNTGKVTIPLAQVTVTDSVPGVTPVRVTPDFLGDNDDLLEPGEMWKYVATGTVLDLSQSPPPAGAKIVQGCGNVSTGKLMRNTYENSGVVTVPGTTDSDLSHYCNPKPCPKVILKKRRR